MRRRVKNRTGRITERASVIVHLPMAERAAVERLAATGLDITGDVAAAHILSEQLQSTDEARSRLWERHARARHREAHRVPTDRDQRRTSARLCREYTLEPTRRDADAAAQRQIRAPRQRERACQRHARGRRELQGIEAHELPAREQRDILGAQRGARITGDHADRGQCGTIDRQFAQFDRDAPRQNTRLELLR